MSGSKHFDKIAWVAISIALVITILFMNGTVLGIELKDRVLGYENRLFDNSRVHSIDIVMNDWDTFISNAQSEEYYTAAVVIDGESYKNVAIRGKGNTSLSTVSSMNSNRYSFKIEFDHYDNSLTYHGLDKLSLNNLIQDSTMMKDYLTYTMMNEFDANSPLCSFVYITVNGNDWGLYLAVEGVEDAFLERNYGSNYGELYKPDSLSFGGGRGNGKDFDMNDFADQFSSATNTRSSTNTAKRTSTDTTTPEASFGSRPSKNTEGFDFSQMFGGGNGGGFGGFGMGSSDVKLQYIDDNLSSYSNIWNNAKTDITEADQYRLINSLKTLSNYENIESVVDVEQVIRYFVVHNFVCNGDSYTGSMIHNYYLYEENGQLSMIPWDYNLAYGTFSGGKGSSTVNTPIDSPTSGSSEDRPMLHWIFESEEYTEMYHEYFSEFLETVDIVAIIDNAYEIISPYVEKDPTKFYTVEEFELGVSTIRQFCIMRSESISLQLENGETVSNMNYVDASSINLSDMGSMGGSMGGGRTKQEKSNKNFDSSTIPTASFTSTDTTVPDDFPQNWQGQLPEGMPSELPEGMQPPSGNSGSETMPNNMPSNMPSFNFGDMSQNPSFNGSSNQPSSQNPILTGNAETILLIAISVIILAIGLIIAKLYKY